MADNRTDSKSRDIRKRAGRSQEWAAVMSRTSVPTVRLFEIAGPDAITDERKRAALVRLYAELSPDQTRTG